MNLVLLLVAFQPWTTPSSLETITRVFAAISVFSVEMQAVTWLGTGSISTLIPVNVVVAVALLAAQRRMRTPDRAATLSPREAVAPWAMLSMAALVLALNVTLPVRGADPYHLEKADRIGRFGTLAYDTAEEKKLNVLNSVYEMLLADLRQIPLAGALAVRLHGIWGLLLYLIAIAAARELYQSRAQSGVPSPSGAPGWPWAAMLVVPVLFQQLVLIKNDLFVAIPALVVLTWIVTRSSTASWHDIVWASWLAGFAVAVKLTMMPLLLVLAGAIVIEHGIDWKPIVAVATGVLIGVVTGGLIFTLVENVHVYGAIMPVGDQGSVNLRLADVGVGMSRFAISLFDLGLKTRVWWPGRGGWGGTFGLPFIWAIAVLVWSARRSRLARNGLICAAVYFLAFALVFPDADLAHRLALAPGLMVVSVAVAILEREDRAHAWHIALIPVLILSSAQITRSAWLYLAR